ILVDYLNEININIEGIKTSFKDYDIVGLGGSLFTPFNTPNEYNEDYYKEILNKLKTDLSDKPLIVVSHQPPFNTIIDKIMAVMHVGSKSLRKFIEEINPILCLCGHIHESIGIDEIRNTKIVNPGTWRSKNYASIKIDENKNLDIRILKA
ncbi:metallophosphoesterase, partial [Bacteroidota bacterium]